MHHLYLLLAAFPTHPSFETQFFTDMGRVFILPSHSLPCSFVLTQGVCVLGPE